MSSMFSASCISYICILYSATIDVLSDCPSNSISNSWINRCASSFMIHFFQSTSSSLVHNDAIQKFAQPTSFLLLLLNDNISGLALYLVLANMLQYILAFLICVNPDIVNLLLFVNYFHYDFQFLSLIHNRTCLVHSIIVKRVKMYFLLLIRD